MDAPSLDNQPPAPPNYRAVADIDALPFLPALRISCGQAGFPAAFAGLRRPPQAIWTRGRLPAADERAVAMVGSRAATRARVELASDVAGDLAAAGWAVVSGGALGIDAAAHRGALAAGGATFAVLGCGVDVVYPDRHGALYADITRAGGLVSEYAPGTPPRPGQFPVRNRLVAALSEGVVVVEAKRSSGALITARLAREQGRSVMAIPGSTGTDDLIRTGWAMPVQDAASVRAVLDGEAAGRPSLGSEATAASEAPSPLAALVAALEKGGPATKPDLSRRLGWSIATVLGLITEAEICGLVGCAPDGRYEVTRAR